MDKGQVSDDAEGLRNMLDPGQTIAWLGEAMRRHEGDHPRPAAGVLRE